ncbi:MAG: Asp-tRNA(Asn)/Glu-tRNA(Gln) amidotransferase subunit GatC [Anaerolineae bacterium]|jgi:aspartyl-tRNA(Asn)/glutamyl-tRNA(Gln) amidotransferase subunit C|nr:Asp-tRNA(Asn)/Glu-tRNA(Gln) amidotransferase subunit GatC [Chloroflexota bacterium]
MALTREQVLQIAELAKLKLTDQEVDLFVDQLSAILDYAQQLNELNTDAIPPTAQVFTQRNALRDDVLQPCLTPDQALANAPRWQDNYFQVPQILE